MQDADQSTTPTTLEVELKFAIADGPALLSTLHEIGATFVGQEQHADTYYAHPCRDFVQTGEALRIRKVDGVAHVTFKGPKQPGPVKTRRELEWSLGADDVNGRKTHELWTLLGFREVATVYKRRQVFSCQLSGSDEAGSSALTVTVDDVEEVGLYLEIERVVEAEGAERAKADILQLATRLGLQQPEPSSYLRLLLQTRK